MARAIRPRWALGILMARAIRPRWALGILMARAIRPRWALGILMARAIKARWALGILMAGAIKKPRPALGQCCYSPRYAFRTSGLARSSRPGPDMNTSPVS